MEITVVKELAMLQMMMNNIMMAQGDTTMLNMMMKNPQMQEMM